jgi:hypothetical protein
MTWDLKLLLSFVLHYITFTSKVRRTSPDHLLVSHNMHTCYIFLSLKTFVFLEKEKNLNAMLKFDFEVQVYHTCTRKSGETYVCRPLL